MKKLLFIFFFPFLLQSQNAITGVYIYSISSIADNWCHHGDWCHAKGDGLFCEKQQKEQISKLEYLKKEVARLEEEIKLLKNKNP